MEADNLFQYIPEPTIEIIDHTGFHADDPNRYVAELLVYVKSTRLSLDVERRYQIRDMSDYDLHKQLTDVSNTIPSSWEFVDVTFLICNLSRAAAQQITRTRTGSYAMQSQRVVNVSDATYRNPFEGDWGQRFDDAVRVVFDEYGELINEGASLSDARQMLPIGTHCNLLAKYNLRSFVDLINSRRSLRTDSEYFSVITSMEIIFKEIFPWLSVFFEHPQDKAIKMLEEVVKEGEFTVGSGPGWKIAKAIDLIRKG